jgi:hypothetical protein
MNLDFASGIHLQFKAAHEAGVSAFDCRIPVASHESNRMTVGMRADNLPKVNHRITLNRHPAGFYRVAVESALGMACPDPLAGGEMDIANAPQDVIDGPEVQHYEGIVVVSEPDRYKIIGAGYDGSFGRVSGLGEEMQDMFVAQIANVATRHALLVGAALSN